MMISRRKHGPRRPTRNPSQQPVGETIPRKQVWKPGTMLCPVPVVMVSTAGKGGLFPNIATVAWTGTVCSEPPMLSISLRKSRLSHQLIMESGDFVVNVPSLRQIPATDYCGVASGRDVNKFQKLGLTAAPASSVSAPIIAECPINIECVVRQVLELGVHTMFVGEITAVQVSADLVTREGRLDIERAGLAAYAHGGYYVLGKKIGYFGFSVRKRAKQK